MPILVRCFDDRGSASPGRLRPLPALALPQPSTLPSPLAHDGGDVEHFLGCRFAMNRPQLPLRLADALGKPVASRFRRHQPCSMF